MLGSSIRRRFSRRWLMSACCDIRPSRADCSRRARPWSSGTARAGLGFPWIADEVFADYSDLKAGWATRRRLVNLPHKALTFSLNGLSKSAALPQMKLGWIVASGSGHQDALRRLEWIADTYLSVSAPV